MPKINVIPLPHDQYDDIVSALGVTRVELARICGVEPDTIGWYRYKKRIPTEHLMAIQVALEKKLKGRRDLTPVEQRALTHLAVTLVSGSATPLSSNSAFASVFGAVPPARTAITKPDLSKVDLKDLIEAIRQHGGSVTFGGEQRDSRKRIKKR
jgi:hypothetical protein